MAGVQFNPSTLKVKYVAASNAVQMAQWCLDCDPCEPDLFINGQTPCVVYATFSGVSMCTGDNAPEGIGLENRAYRMIQDSACEWREAPEEEPLYLSWRPSLGQMFALHYDVVTPFGDHEIYFAHHPDTEDCTFSIDNEATDSDFCGELRSSMYHWRGYGGSVTFSW